MRKGEAIPFHCTPWGYRARFLRSWLNPRTSYSISRLLLSLSLSLSLFHSTVRWAKSLSFRRPSQASYLRFLTQCIIYSRINRLPTDDFTPPSMCFHTKEGQCWLTLTHPDGLQTNTYFFFLLFIKR